MEYTITSIVGNDTTFTFTKDGVTDTLTVANFPLEDKDALEQAIVEHVNAYLAGKALEAQVEQVAPAVESIVGVKQTI